MKRAILFLFLIGCSTAPKIPLYTYECAILGRHGVFAKMVGQYASEVAAEEDAERGRLQLVGQKQVPENSGVMCYRP